MKVLFASGSMQGGGAERVVSILANDFASRGWRVSILVVRGASVYPLDAAVRVVPVYQEADITSSLGNKILRRLSYVPRLLARVFMERPDVIVPVHGDGWNGMFIMLAKLLGIKVVAAEHISHTAGRPGWRRFLERRVLYRMADQVTVLTRFDFDHYRHFIRRLTWIPNPLGFAPVDSIGQREKVVLAAGQLDRWSHKGFDKLLEVFATVAPRHPGWRLEIAGSGDLGRSYLQQRVEALGLNERVVFLGFQKDIDQVMRRASVFVLSSRFEGFGMVLLEAMSQGCACVSFDCEAGPAEIITSGLDGLIVSNQDNASMASALDRLLTDGGLRARLAASGLDTVKKYSPRSIGHQWADLFRSLGLQT